jgi:lysophospholipase L1-like esterase
LTPNEIDQLNTLLNQIGDHIRAQATARGFGFFSMGVLFDRPDLKGGPYSIIAQLTSKYPYGIYTSLDGVHPNALGHAVLAAAAAFGYNQTYFGHDVASHGASANLIASAPALSLGDQLEEPELPAAALAQAQRIAAANAGRKVSGCIVPVAGMPGC